MNQKRSRGRGWVYLSGSTIYNNHSNIILMLSTLAIILVHWLAMKTACFSISTPRLGDPSEKVTQTKCCSFGRPCLIYCGHLQVIILHTIQLHIILHSYYNYTGNAARVHINPCIFPSMSLSSSLRSPH